MERVTLFEQDTHLQEQNQGIPRPKLETRNNQLVLMGPGDCQDSKVYLRESEMK